ncbi:histidine--tRNA ligase [Candidatus Pacearchaeota archaeon]|nr:histidine--tRNA ligase [Candidatus Pacearchaeota archaeon]
MQKEIDNVKGFQDFLPPESLKRDYVKKIIEKWFNLYGFVPIETPVIEFEELMASGSEDEAVSDRFRLTDRGNRKLGLRYEFTFQLARIFRQNPNIKLPFRRYQIGEVFRDEPTSSERFRQFTQCDADIIGDSSTNSDAECIALFADILKELKINHEIKINSRKLLNSIIKSVQIRDSDAVMRELDKKEKQGVDAVKINLRKYAESSQIITLFKLLEKDIKFFKENAFDGIDELNELAESCSQHKIKVKFEPWLARGLSYYTGNIFEISSQKSSIAGGGRYDNVVGKYSARQIPAVGISFGLERLTKLVETKTEDSPKVILISISQDAEAIKLSKQLRKSNVPCTIFFDKPSKALDYANSKKIPYSIFIGEEEIGKKKYKLKNMETGKEALLTENQLLKKLA